MSAKRAARVVLMITAIFGKSVIGCSFSIRRAAPAAAQNL
jgi:hypothetical protein